jgi:hypothetical protein
MPAMEMPELRHEQKLHDLVFVDARATAAYDHSASEQTHDNEPSQGEAIDIIKLTCSEHDGHHGVEPEFVCESPVWIDDARPLKEGLEHRGVDQ